MEAYSKEFRRDVLRSCDAGVGISEGPFFRSDKQSTAFREWLEQVGGETEALPEDAFQGREAFRETGIRTRLLTVDKE